jgi:hypothetical protein
MAGVKGRSGGANGGPQYSPANVSATGGNGQRGDYKGFGYGQNKALNEQRTAAPITPQQTPAPGPMTPMATQDRSLPPVPGITEPSMRPNEPITEGVDGPSAGGGSSSLVMPGMTDVDVDAARLISYLPALEVAARSPNASQAFRNYVRIIRAKS